MREKFVGRILLFIIVSVIVSTFVVFLWTSISDYSSSLKNNEKDFETYIEKTVGYDIDVLTAVEQDNYKYIMFTKKGSKGANIFAFKKWHFNRFIDAGAIFHSNDLKQDKSSKSLFGALNIIDEKNKQKYVVFGINSSDIAKYYTIDINEKEFKREITDAYFIDVLDFNEMNTLKLRSIKFYGKHDEDVTDKLIIKDEEGQ
ncbi:hypothetical protein [Clostridium folliculivorans]|uniref:Uncharacterized protein n=1 Tax=Clostridium folliculivorans TaxID=2886038 RepID=A0A9W6DBD1_9CLOT|nr:hypothetical protein [Clostridium folliculivorans]GKU25593.1 hypothetical protein CFOLD11_24190 [Clostridium folliculivorans]GKU28615.1 hypothetical protein CFB3_07210 [Clostridium folliculivorans]